MIRQLSRPISAFMTGFGTGQVLQHHYWGYWLIGTGITLLAVWIMLSRESRRGVHSCRVRIRRERER